MNRERHRLRAGDWVAVKSPRDIAHTLDAEGTLDGLPFMPEMLEFCGRRFRVARLAEKTCIEYPGGAVKIQGFEHKSTVILEGLRCSGLNHDGCQRACTIFWKNAWLRKVEADEPVVPVDRVSWEGLSPALKVAAAPGHYFCQSTQLHRATHPVSRAWVIRKCFSDVWSGSRGLFEMIRFVLVPLWRYFIPSTFFRPLVVGRLKQTPIGNLDLQPGEWVKIKSETDIVETLDGRARNHGLRCDQGMRTYCGGEFQVRNRLDHMILEATGEMRQVKSTVLLEGLNCMCWWNHVGGCPRGEYMYWREVWLERVSRSKGRSPGDDLEQPSQN